MSAIGDDIAEVLAELGSAITIYKYVTGQTFQEYVDPNYEVNHVYPWTSHYMIKGDFGYNTRAEPGDLLTFIDDPNGITRYLLVALAKERFEREIIAKEGVLYMCNKIVQILELGATTDDNYEQVSTWNNKYSGEYAFVTGDIDSNKERKEQFGEFAIDSNHIYFSTHLDVQQDDRCIVKDSITDVSGEIFRVTVVEKHRLPGVNICKIVQDDRE